MHATEHAKHSSAKATSVSVSQPETTRTKRPWSIDPVHTTEVEQVCTLGFRPTLCSVLVLQKRDKPRLTHRKYKSKLHPKEGSESLPASYFSVNSLGQIVCKVVKGLQPLTVFI